ncbi:hypothetical protein [Candidatus Magnetominusculus dajiuhuensis]|uniref:hypothetical protein n=1 Tax=Candidatus Magnetominusculus dajiuhuensis TaxID=3137712 RepID=UPI003B439C9C
MVSNVSVINGDPLATLKAFHSQVKAEVVQGAAQTTPPAQNVKPTNNNPEGTGSKVNLYA